MLALSPTLSGRGRGGVLARLGESSYRESQATGTADSLGAERR
jgi:hypothetical protein